MPSSPIRGSGPEPGLIGSALAGLLAEGRPWRLGRQVVSVAAVTSTNDLARVLALSGADEGTVVVADTQTSGRGRLGRAWHSPAGAGLWSSFILRPQTSLPTLAPLALVVAVGARRAAVACGAEGVGIKWPNDLVAGGRKLAGILTEGAGGSELSAPEFVVAGIGVNVRTPDGGFPEPVRGVAIALDELLNAKIPRFAVGPAEYGRALVEHLSETYSEFVAGGFASLREEWLAANVTTGREIVVTVAGAGGALNGIAEDIDIGGRLIVRLPGGGTAAVAAGDVTLRT